MTKNDLTFLNAEDKVNVINKKVKTMCVCVR